MQYPIIIVMDADSIFGSDRSYSVMRLMALIKGNLQWAKGKEIKDVAFSKKRNIAGKLLLTVLSRAISPNMGIPKK